MFDIIKTLFSQQQPGLLAEAHSLFVDMLDEAGVILDEGMPHLLSPDMPSDMLTKARAIDKQSNRQEREIRKRLVEYLAFAPTHAPLGLVLMSAAKDAERLIDECRGLLSLSTDITSPIPDSYRQTISERTATIHTLIAQTRKAWADNDRKQALELVEGEKPFLTAIDAVQNHIMDDASLDLRQGVIIIQALLGIKRLRAHLANIASTVIMPLHRIDFAKRKFVEEARREIDAEAGRDLD